MSIKERAVTKNKKFLKLVFIICILMISIIGQGSYALLVDRTDQQDETFSPAAINITISSNGCANNAIALKANTTAAMPVSITNESTSSDGRVGVEAYIRVAIIPIWYHSDGTATALPSDNVTLTLSSTGKTDWLYGKDGYYYYKYPVAAGTTTSQLLSKVSWSLTGTTDLDAQYKASKLEIQVLADSIQSVTNSVENYWGVQINSNGNLGLTPANTP